MIKKLKEQRATELLTMERLSNLALNEKRSMNETERSEFNAAEQRVNDLSSQINAFEKEERARLLKLEKREATEDTQETEQRAAFVAYMKGNASSEQRDSIAGLDGSVTVPSSIAKEVEKALNDRGDFLSAITLVYTPTGGDYVVPVINTSSDRATAKAALAESATASKTILSITIKSYTYRTSIIPISNELLADSSNNVEAVIVDALADSLWAGLNYDFTNGSGVNEAKGIMTGITVGVTTSSSTSISYDDLVDLRKSVNRAYSKSSVASFMFNSNTQAELLKIKDSDGRPMYIASMTEGVPDKLFGAPVIVNEDMPDIAAGAKPITFGNHKKYQGRIVRGVGAIRFDEEYKKYFAIGLMGYVRADGALIDAGTHPVKALQCKAATVES